MQEHVFDTEQKAQASVNAVSAKMGCPRRGKDMQGRPAADDKAKTERWAYIRQRLDGKWTYPRPPEDFVVIGNPHYEIEEYDEDNYPQPEKTP